MNYFRQTVVLAALLLLGLLGPLIGVDFGGVFCWTQYIGGVAILGIALVAVTFAITREHYTGLKQLLIACPLVVWAAYSWGQCQPIAEDWVAKLSPGSYQAYTSWLQPIIPTEMLPTSFPLSISPYQTRHATSVIALLPALVYSVIVFCRQRNHIVFLLIVMCLGVGLHAAYGVLSVLFPSLSMQDGDVHKLGFGTYVNHNNIAYLFNLGIAAGLALLASRLFSISRSRSRKAKFSIDAISMISIDSSTVLAAFTIVTCTIGLLMCGSRSGLLAVAIGGMSMVAWLRRREGWTSIPRIILATSFIVLLSLLLIGPFASFFGSVDRFSEVDLKGSESVFENPRFLHWPVSLRTAFEYLPVGAGVGSYSFAYLPYQDQGYTGWFHHADNLWLELFVEQGVIGIGLALALVFVVLRSLFQLSHSRDPLDVGLQVACVYFLGSTAWSQTFDFGLIVPGNLVTVAVMIGLFVSRGHALKATLSNAAEESESSIGQKRLVEFIGVRQRLGAFFVGSGVVGLAVLSIPGLWRDAVSEGVSRTIEQTLLSPTIELESLESSINLAEDALSIQATPRLLVLSSELNRRLGRWQLVQSREPETKADLENALSETETAFLRKQWRGEGGLAVKLPAPYQKALESTRSSLLMEPLGLEAREQVIILDFVHRDASESAAAVKQLAELQKGAADTLVALANWASVSGDELAVARLWKLATQVDRGKTKFALAYARGDSSRVINDYVDDHPVCVRFVSRVLLQDWEGDSNSKQQSKDYLTNAIDKLECQSCETNRERALCEQVAGGILLQDGKTSEALARFTEAISRQSADISLRRDVIARLRKAGLLQEAADLATNSFRDIPEHFPFQSIANEILAEIAAKKDSGKSNRLVD